MTDPTPTDPRPTDPRPADSTVPPRIAVEDLRFAYPGDGFAIAVDAFTLRHDERVACIGPSGCGKTTFVHLCCGILAPDAGRVQLCGHELTTVSETRRRALRIRHVGMVFQQFELLEYLTALENIVLPYHVTDALELDDEVGARAQRLARTAGIEHVLRRKPAALSQGERQRVAICRALITEPDVVLCDEPTGNLDPATAGAVLDLLFEQVRAHDAALLMVTHDHGLLDRFDATIDMQALARLPA